ncbi:MAG: regulatory protein RecX [Gammaproteobacteria bacterium]|nr:MAG: regulatory protein RecX [Gammaproteobacteria bacterium]
MDLLARREHSRAELGGKLARVGADPELLEAVLDELEAERLLSDERFVEAFIRSRRERGQGPLKIAEELRRRGVDGELLARHLEQDDPSWIDIAASARERRFGASHPADQRDKARQLRFLAGRGFTREQAWRALERRRPV